MDYEKAYKEALERAKNLYKDAIILQLEQDIKDYEYIFPVLAESEDEKIRKALLEYFGEQCDMSDWNGVYGYQVVAWLEKQGQTFTKEDIDKAFGKRELEKQGIERKQLYVRFGDIPSNEKSKIYCGEEEIGDENGVSVYPAFELNGNVVLGLTLPITKTTLYTQQHLLEYDDRPCYLVSGDYVGKGTDGEPLIRNISIIKRLDNYRIKELEKQGNSNFEQCIQDGDKIVTNEDGTHFNVSQLERVAKKESSWNEEDDKIRKKILLSLEKDLMAAKNSGCNTKDFEECITWLEKQGEQKPINDTDEDIVNAVKDTSVLDLVEPKFKVGDWIVSNVSHEDYRICKILKIENGEYVIESIYGYQGHNNFEAFDKDYHLWTIEDAKDGDVLQLGEVTAIFKKYIGNKRCTCYCSFCKAGGFEIPSQNGEDNVYGCYDDTTPATKEQSDILFQKMKEAGYGWNAEKKELNKIHVIDEGKAEMDYCFTKMMNGEKVSSAWSEEDENILEAITYTVKNSGYSHCIGVSIEVMIDWLKSLKERMKGEQSI